jgi:(1->4)-alpha-D-glucan 1-alpha-D-glucosylmutase
MAKGVEDTAFYRYARLLTLNEVGGDPSRFGISVEQFHEANLERSERFPLNLLTTQTHDAKRSADVRARIGVLASMPDEWREHTERWLSLGGVPDPLEAYVVFQTLVGAWPIEAERMEAYMEKALREAKRTSNWIEPNLEHEEAVKAFVRGLYSDRRFLDDFEPFVARVAAAGERAALGQLALKLTAPGVPDIYQGDELSYRALVDPDNRRPVDFERRRALLASLEGGAGPDADTRKLWLTWRLLQLRAERPTAFAGGSYEPVDAGENVCAYVRGGEVLVAVAVREGAEVPKPHGDWRDLLRLDEQGLAVLVR